MRTDEEKRWDRDRREERSRFREHREFNTELRMSADVRDGRYTIVRPLGLYGYRLQCGERLADFWPRTGRWQSMDADRTEEGVGYAGVLRYLGVRPRKDRDPAGNPTPSTGTE